MSAIDWGKQNKNYPLWLEGKGEHAKHSGWYRRVGEVFEHETHGQFRAVREGQFFDVFTKPEWTGEGYPPVGSEVEIQRGGWYVREESECFIGAKVVVRAQFRMGSGAEMIAVDGGADLGCEVFRAEMARPIPTPEQIAAAEEHAKAIRVLIESTDYILDETAAAAVLAAGYRKPE